MRSVLLPTVANDGSARIAKCFVNGRKSPAGRSVSGNQDLEGFEATALNLRPECDNQAMKGKTEEFKFTEGTESHGQHAKSFLECIRTRNKPVCTPEMGKAAAIHVHIPDIAARCGESMLIRDETTGKFASSEMANEYITPEYSKPWALPVI